MCKCSEARKSGFLPNLSVVGPGFRQGGIGSSKGDWGRGWKWGPSLGAGILFCVPLTLRNHGRVVRSPQEVEAPTLWLVEDGLRVKKTSEVGEKNCYHSLVRKKSVEWKQLSGEDGAVSL